MGNSSNFVMELPNYHFPKIKSLLIHSWLKLKDYVLRAGKDSAKMYTTMRSYFHNGGHDGFNWQVFAFLVFVLLYVPCLAAMGVVVREIGLGLGS